MRFATPRRFGRAECVSGGVTRPTPVRRSAGLLGAFLGILAACANPAEPPTGAPMTAPPASLWEAMEACSGRSGDPGRVAWYAVPPDSGAFFRWDGAARAGLWVRPHAIYLAAPYAADPLLIQHEMLHDLLQTGTHPDAFTRCGVRYPVLVEIP